MIIYCLAAAYFQIVLTLSGQTKWRRQSFEWSQPCQKKKKWRNVI